MLKFSMLIFGCYLIFNGISSISSGVISSIIGPGVAASHKLINYQESPLSFILEVIVHLGIGGGLIIAAVKLIRKDKN